MKKITLRQARVGDLLKETIAEIIGRRVKDPRVEDVTITDVEVSVDMRVANVYFCVHEGGDHHDAQDGLEKAEGFIRHEVMKQVRLRNIPNLNFRYDKSFDYGSRIEHIIGELKHDADEDS